MPAVFQGNPGLAGYTGLTESAYVDINTVVFFRIINAYAIHMGLAFFFVVAFFRYGPNRASFHTHSADALREEEAVLGVLLVRPYRRRNLNLCY